MQTADLRGLLRISQLAAPLGDARWVNLVPSPRGLTSHYNGMHSGGMTAIEGATIEGLKAPLMINAKLLADGLDVLAADEVKVTVSRGSLVLAAAGQRLTIRGSVGQDPPRPTKLAKTAPSLAIKTDVLLDTVRFLRQAVGGPQGAPQLTGIHITATGQDTARLEATDGVAGAITTLAVLNDNGAVDALVPAADLDAAIDTLSDHPVVVLRFSETTCEVLAPGTYIRLSQLSDQAKYPDLDKLPLDGYGVEFEVPSAKVVAAAQAAGFMHHQRIIDLICADGKLRLVTSDDEQGSYELAVSKVDAPDFTLHLDGEYLRMVASMGEVVSVAAAHPKVGLVHFKGAGRFYWLAEVAVSGRRKQAEAAA